MKKPNGKAKPRDLPPEAREYVDAVETKLITARSVERSAATAVAKAETACRRANQRVTAMESTMRAVEKRYQHVLLRFVEYPGDNMKAYFRRLAENALLGGKIGSVPWAFTGRLLRDSKTTGSCPHCTISTYGEPSLPAGAFMPCNVAGCPYEVGVEQTPLTYDDIEIMSNARQGEEPL